MNKEIWKDVIGYEGLYQVSNHGRIKSLKFNKERILKPGLNNTGYFIVNLFINNKSKIYKIHRLIAIHFVPNPVNKPQVNHKDGNKLNNHVDNLEWCTRSENMKHAWKNGLCENVRKKAIKQGSMNGKEYLSKKVQCIETGIVYESGIQAERKTGINNSNISKCCKGKRKSVGKHPDNKKIKLTWKYV